MTTRENLISMYKRRGYERAPVEFDLCPALLEKFYEYTGDDTKDYRDYFGFDMRYVDILPAKKAEDEMYLKYFDRKFAEGFHVNEYGVVSEPGSEYALHMTHMNHPMERLCELKQLEEYPFPQFDISFGEKQKSQVEAIHNAGLVATADYACTIWERSWYMRSMPELMCDMMCGDAKAEFLLDKLTSDAILQCESLAYAGVDILRLGDDIGMQKTIMMSEELYRKWIKPRLKKVIEAVKKIKPNILIQYHSCGYVTPFIADLIDVGVDILNPVQPECMDFKEIHAKFGKNLSFNGTVGTQTIMPFGTTNDVKKTVRQNLETAGSVGGLLCAPTHLLEPEVPWDNVLAYVEAVRDFNPNKV